MKEKSQVSKARPGPPVDLLLEQWEILSPTRHVYFVKRIVTTATAFPRRRRVSCFRTQPLYEGLVRKIRMSSKRCLATLFVLISPLLQAQNKGLKVTLDPAQTEVHWKLTGLHTTHGTFKLKSGEFFLNPATGMAEGEILVDATTGESGNADRDKRMQEEVLESNRYPAVFFHPTQIKGAFKQGEGTQDLVGEGTFNIHGADHPLEMPLKVQIAGGAVTATAHFTVP